MTPEALSRLAPSVQPLIFETGISEAPYSLAGTAFVVGYQGRVFVITARHSLRPDSLGPICIFPTDSSRRLIPLKDVFFVSETYVPDDFMDLAVMEVDLPRAAHPELGEALIIDLQLASGDWLSSSEHSEFVVIGFPEEHSFVDYENEMIRTDRITLSGRYIGQSPSRYLHELEILDTRGLATFSGFSGGPVFAWIEHPGRRAQISLCGMALRGTPSSRRLHFLDRSVLIDALEVKCKRTLAQD